ncbi:hypothetical protein HQ576_16180, partial [bacterium]|nr:hypothetical protein [bacterium]
PDSVRPSLTLNDTKDEQLAYWRQANPDDATILLHHAKQPGTVLCRVQSTGVNYSYSSSRTEYSIQPYTLRADYIAGNDASEPNDEAEAAAALPFGEARKATLFPRADQDVYTLDVPKPGIGLLSVVVAGMADSIAPRVDLHDAEGKKIASWSGARGAEPRVQHELKAAGTILLHVFDGDVREGKHGTGFYDDYSPEPYTVRATFTPATDTHEPNDEHDTARAVALGKPVQGTLFPVRDNDFYKFTIPQPGRGVLRIRAEGFNDKMHPALRFYDTAKKEIASVKQSRGQPVTLTHLLAGGGDFFVQVYDGDFNDGRTRESANDSSSLDPYTLTVTYDAVPGAEHEPNSTFETAEALPFGEERKASLFPANDLDVYKVDITEAQLGHVQVHVGDFHDFVRPRVTLFGADKRRIADLYHTTPRAILAIELKKAGTHYIHVRAYGLQKGGRSFGTHEQFATAPYTIRIAKPAAAPTTPNEREPNNAFATAQAIQAGQQVVGTIGEKMDRDWYALTLDQPATLDLFLRHTPPELDLRLNVYHYPRGKTPARPKKVLYLRGHPHFNLDRRFPDVQFTRIDHAAKEAKAACANVAVMRQYDAIVLGSLHDPRLLDLASPRVQANITQYVQAGGRFIILSPCCALELFGVKIAEPGRWHDDAVVDLGARHPLLPEGTAGRVRGWGVKESVGYLTGWQAAGFQMLYAHASDPDQHAVTIAKSIGTGHLVWEMQPVGHQAAFPHADWKFRSYLGLPQP